MSRIVYENRTTFGTYRGPHAGPARADDPVRPEGDDWYLMVHDRDDRWSPDLDVAAVAHGGGRCATFRAEAQTGAHEGPARVSGGHMSARVEATIAFARENFRNDGAEGESVHLLCDEVERLTKALKTANDRADAAEARLRRYEGGSCAGMLDRT